MSTEYSIHLPTRHSYTKQCTVTTILDTLKKHFKILWSSFYAINIKIIDTFKKLAQITKDTFRNSTYLPWNILYRDYSPSCTSLSCIKFHQYQFIHLGEVELTRHFDRWTDWFLYSPRIMVCRGYKMVHWNMTVKYTGYLLLTTKSLAFSNWYFLH